MAQQLYFLYKEKIFYIRSTNSASVCALQCMSLPTLPFYATQIINPFLTSSISVNYDKGLEFQPIGESLYSLISLQCRISFVQKQQINIIFWLIKIENIRLLQIQINLPGQLGNTYYIKDLLLLIFVFNYVKNFIPKLF